MSQGKPSTVLLIEADSSLRRLMALGLQHRGMRVIEASSPAHIPSFDALQVDLLVLDLDGNAGRNHTFLASTHDILIHSLLSAVPTILLAWEYAPALTQNVAVATNIQYLTKPFDARILHETIDQLLLVKRADEAAYEAQAEARLLATYSHQTSPSLWPIITAAGLLLAFIGMMLQIVITIVGVLIVAVALLLWTLGSKSSAEKVALV
jgi:DNA-binding response OmpR family regulator